MSEGAGSLHCIHTGYELGAPTIRLHRLTNEVTYSLVY